MIEPHIKLTEAFSHLPLVTGKRANYKWGNEYHLNKLLKLYQNDPDKMDSFYPLIYNISNRTVDNKRTGYVEYNPVSLVIATRNTQVDWTNGNRWATSYQNVLFPLKDYIIQLFRKSQMFLTGDEIVTLEFPNYTNEDMNVTTDIWDALRLDLKLIITNKCYVDILFDIETTT